MKKICCIIFTLIIGCIGFFGCVHSPQVVYRIGRLYSFDYANFILTIDKENEVFVFEYDSKMEGSNWFYFVFTHHTSMEYINGDEFEYLDNLGGQIVFDENGVFEFEGEKIFCISYANASEEIKSVINQGYFEVHVCVLLFTIEDD